MNKNNDNQVSDDDNYYLNNSDPLKELADDIIEETTFFRYNTPLLPPLPSSIANDTEILDIKLYKK